MKEKISLIKNIIHAQIAKDCILKMFDSVTKKNAVPPELVKIRQKLKVRLTNTNSLCP